MGKKRITQQTGSELVEAIEKVEQKVAKEAAQQPVVPVVSKKLKEGRVSVYSSYNNTIITLADLSGNVIATASAGAIGFRGSKKATPFASSKVADVVAQAAKGKGIERIVITVKGVGSGRDSALRTLGAKGFDIIGITDITPIPHNGPKAPKVRRI